MLTIYYVGSIVIVIAVMLGEKQRQRKFIVGSQFWYLGVGVQLGDSINGWGTVLIVRRQRWQFGDNLESFEILLIKKILYLGDSIGSLEILLIEKTVYLGDSIGILRKALIFGKIHFGLPKTNENGKKEKKVWFR